MPKHLITAALLTAAVLFAATAEAKQGKTMQAARVKSQEVTMADGSKATVHVVKVKLKGVWTGFAVLQPHVAPIGGTRKVVSDLPSRERAYHADLPMNDKIPDALHQQLFTVGH